MNYDKWMLRILNTWFIFCLALILSSPLYGWEFWIGFASKEAIPQILWAGSFLGGYWLLTNIWKAQKSIEEREHNKPKG